jgi:hypothetical protein
MALPGELNHERKFWSWLARSPPRASSCSTVLSGLNPAEMGSAIDLIRRSARAARPFSSST